MIQTSYFAILKRFPIEKCISIARFLPKGIKIKSYQELAPTAEILFAYKKDGNWEKYVKDYTEKVLYPLNVDKVAKDLEGKILFCYEGYGKHCHRHLVSRWLTDNGYPCEEATL